MGHYFRKARAPASTSRDYMIAKHSNPSHSTWPKAASPPHSPQFPHSSNSTQESDKHSIITATSSLEMLTSDGESVNLHETKHVIRLSHAMEEMKRIDINFGNTDVKSEAHREILLQEMLPEFLPMRDVWQQEWNILRRRKAEVLRDRWEQGIFSEKERAIFEITSDHLQKAATTRRRSTRRFLVGVVGYALLVVGLVGALAWLGVNYKRVVAVLEKMEHIDFFLGE
ncbi:hypothetical protein QBC37DRAFT_374056 [Rhypophila decipiens]|uniref:Uncharacterized protein n=1 Tax=Rhypophila decipiens TaxID=261697 RepID=A0AAN6Y7M1_9PEZI|nr:hypothetical protein QBC37DRAFT_374056 [Rhypophila decipiens]